MHVDPLLTGTMGEGCPFSEITYLFQQGKCLQKAEKVEQLHTDTGNLDALSVLTLYCASSSV